MPDVVKTMHKIQPKVHKNIPVPQICSDSKKKMLGNWIEVFAGHSIMGTHVTPMGVGHLINDFFLISRRIGRNSFPPAGGTPAIMSKKE